MFEVGVLYGEKVLFIIDWFRMYLFNVELNYFLKLSLVFSELLIGVLLFILSLFCELLNIGDKIMVEL